MNQLYAQRPLMYQTICFSQRSMKTVMISPLVMLVILDFLQFWRTKAVSPWQMFPLAQQMQYISLLSQYPQSMSDLSLLSVNTPTEIRPNSVSSILTWKQQMPSWLTGAAAYAMISSSVIFLMWRRSLPTYLQFLRKDCCWWSSSSCTGRLYFCRKGMLLQDLESQLAWMSIIQLASLSAYCRRESISSRMEVMTFSRWATSFCVSRDLACSCCNCLLQSFISLRD